MKAAQRDIVGDVRKIVVLRPNALGDFVFCLPALHALKVRYPGAHITFIGKQWHADFLEGRPGPIDEVVVMPPFPGMGAPLEEPAVDATAMRDGRDATVAGANSAAIAGGNSAAVAGGNSPTIAGGNSATLDGANSAAIAGGNSAAVTGENSPAIAGENDVTQTGAQKITHARAAFIERMRAEHFDLAIQLYGGGRFANPLVKQFGARYCLGMKAADAAPLDRSLAFDGVINKRLQLLEVAALADAASWPMHARLHVTARDRDAAAACLANSMLVPPVDVRSFASTPPAVAPELLQTDTVLLAADAPSTSDARISPCIAQGPWVLLQPGSTDPRRCWPAQKFARLGDALAALGARICINGTADEAALVASIVAAMHYPAVDLSGKASLPALCGLIEQCSLVVSNDTGPLHLALEIGTPAVGIYWLTNLIESAPLRQQGHRAVVSLQVHCSVCGAENVTARCAHDPSFVADVHLEEVLGHALSLLELR